MSISNVFEIASSAIHAQSQRLNTVASNIANAESATTSDGTPYKAKQVVFQAIAPDSGVGASKVQVANVVEDNTAPRRVYDPKHPLADEQGYVAMPNINVVDEMVNMMSASRSYQTNIEVMNTAKTLLLKALTLGQ